MYIYDNDNVNDTYRCVYIYIYIYTYIYIYIYRERERYVNSNTTGVPRRGGRLPRPPALGRPCYTTLNTISAKPPLYMLFHSAF